MENSGRQVSFSIRLDARGQKRRLYETPPGWNSEKIERRTSNIDNLVKSPKFRHTCEGRHPELSKNTGFPPSRE